MGSNCFVCPTCGTITHIHEETNSPPKNGMIFCHDDGSKLVFKGIQHDNGVWTYPKRPVFRESNQPKQSEGSKNSSELNIEFMSNEPINFNCPNCGNPIFFESYKDVPLNCVCSTCGTSLNFKIRVLE